MSDLAEVVLQHVGQNATVDSLRLSSELQQDHQKIVGAIKSIQVSRSLSVDYISSTWRLERIASKAQFLIC